MKKSVFIVIIGLVILAFVFYIYTHMKIDREPSLEKKDIYVSNHFGVDGSDLKYLSEIAKLKDGVTGVNGVKWELLEPKAPVNNVHSYNSISFDKLNKTLTAISQEGRVAQMNILFTNSWALEYSEISTADPTSGTNIRKINNINPENLDDWESLIKKLIREYPQVAFIQIGSEEENAWANSSGYSQALCVAYQAVKETNPDVKVLAAGFNLGEFFGLSEEEQTALKSNPLYEGKLEFIQGVIKEGKGCFDVLTIHPSGREDSIKPMLAWYNEQFAKNNYSKPIWSDDTASGPGVGGTKPLAGEENMFKLIEEDKLRTNLTEYSRLMTLQSELLIKKSVSMFASGAERVILSADVDFIDYYMKGWHYLGLIDPVYNFKKPAYYTYQLEISKLDNFTKAEEIQKDVYKFTLSNGKAIYVAWSDEPKEIDLSSQIDKKANITFIISSLDAKKQPIYKENRIVDSNKISLTSEPVFIESAM